MDDQPVIRSAWGYNEIRAALAVRVAVFVDEQRGPRDEEPDAWDDAAHHFVILSDGEIVGAARVCHAWPGVLQIGRVALLPEYRGRGWGRMLLDELLRYAGSQGARDIVLDAQTSVCGFYEPLGFAAEGEVFFEGGIPHRRMRRRVR